MNKTSENLVLFAVLHHLCLAATAFLSVVAMFLLFAGSHGEMGAVGLVILLMLPFVIGLIVFNCMILHRGWSFVQDGKARTTPGKAVGYMFIPFYNLYWRFVAYRGLMDEFSRVAELRGKGRGTVGNGLATTYCIVSLIPYLQVLLAPIFEILVIWQIIGFVRDNEAV